MRTDVAVSVEGGLTLGWLFAPGGDAGKLPAITMAHEYAGVKGDL